MMAYARTLLLLCATAFARQHEATNFSLAAATDEEEPDGLTRQQKNLILNLHNKYRCMHGAGKVTWSNGLASGARAWIWYKHFMEHDDTYNLPPPFGPAGENLAWNSHRVDIKQALNGWYTECNVCFSGNCKKFSDGCSSGRSAEHVVGHFTSMVWKGVKRVGCSLNKYKTVLSCRYWGGNKNNDNSPNTRGYYAKHVKKKEKTAAQCKQNSKGKKGKGKGGTKKGKGNGKQNSKGKKGKGKGGTKKVKKGKGKKR